MARPMALVLALLVSALLVGVTAAQPAGAQVVTAHPTVSQPGTARLAADPPGTGVTVTLNSMTPRLPQSDPVSEKIVFTATVRNDSDVDYRDLQVQLQRGQVITRQDYLDQALATPPPTDLVSTAPTATGLKLPAHASVDVTYTTTTDYSGLCLCNDGVYPVALVIAGITAIATPVLELARTQIFVPSFQAKPAQVQVSWIWPLIDGPHRALSSTVFTDDALATSVAAGGRLYRALTAAQLATQAGVRIRLLVDPELLDSLVTMATGYTYRKGTATVTGTGGPAAAAWLQSFRAVGAQQDVSLTAYADPDIDAITRAQLRYSTALDPQVHDRLQPYVGGDFTADLLWPADGVITSPALEAAVAAGAASVIVSDRSFPPTDPSRATPNALSQLASAAGQPNALVTDTALQRTVADALSNPGHFAADEQTLLSQLAVRAAQAPSDTHFVVLTPDRYVDADPNVAAEIMKTSASAAWTTSIALNDAIHDVTPAERGSLSTPASAQKQELSPVSLASLAALTSQVNSLRQVFSPTDAATLFGGFNDAAQRAESTRWRTDPTGAALVLNEVTTQATQLTRAIHLVQPTNGTYSLSSQDSPVVVTVENDLAQSVSVRIAVQPALGVLGFQTRPANSFEIPPHSKSTISIPTHVDRLGRFKVVATLSTPDGRQLGQEVALTLRVTAIGGITKAITGIAGLILIVALVWRLVRRLRRGRRSGPNGRGGQTPQPPHPPIRPVTSGATR